MHRMQNKKELFSMFPIVLWPVSLYFCLLDITICYAKTAIPVEMPCGVWTQVGQRNRVFVGSPDSTRRSSSFGELFARWQQRCSLLLSVLQQIVFVC